MLGALGGLPNLHLHAQSPNSVPILWIQACERHEFLHHVILQQDSRYHLPVPCFPQVALSQDLSKSLEVKVVEPWDEVICAESFIPPLRGEDVVAHETGIGEGVEQVAEDLIEDLGGEGLEVLGDGVAVSEA